MIERFRPRWFWIGCAVGWGLVAVSWADGSDFYGALEAAMETVSSLVGRLAGFAFFLWIMAPLMMVAAVLSGLAFAVAVLPLVALAMAGRWLWHRLRPAMNPLDKE